MSAPTMATTSNLELLHRLRDAVSRASDLELADLDRQIRTLERSKPVSHARRVGREHERALLPADDDGDVVLFDTRDHAHLAAAITVG